MNDKSGYVLTHTHYDSKFWILDYLFTLIFCMVHMSIKVHDDIKINVGIPNWLKTIGQIKPAKPHMEST